MFDVQQFEAPSLTYGPESFELFGAASYLTSDSRKIIGHFMIDITQNLSANALASRASSGGLIVLVHDATPKGLHVLGNHTE